MKNLKLYIGVILLISLISCSKTARETSNEVIQEGSPSDPQLFYVDGLVKSIPPNKKQIIIDHGDVPGFMMAMRMPFNVPDTMMLEGIKPSDSVSLAISFDGEAIVLKEINPI